MNLPQSRAGLRILIVDDDPARAELTAEFLKSLDCEVRSLADPRTAIGEMLVWKPSLVVLDLEMPQIHGTEVLRRMRARPELKEIPVVILSMLVDDFWRARRLETAEAIFPKPVNYGRFIDCVKQLAEGPSLGSAA